MLNTGNFMPHMMAYVLKFKISYLNDPRCFPIDAVRNVKITGDVHINDTQRYHGLCFPTVLLKNETFANTGKNSVLLK